MALAVAGGAEAGDGFDELPALDGGGRLEVLGFGGGAVELEAEEAAAVVEAAKAYVWGAVGLGDAALFDLLEVAEPFL